MANILVWRGQERNGRSVKLALHEELQLKRSEA
jgi:hypothetical protein